MRCNYCAALKKNKNSLAQHEIRCVENPNKIQIQHSSETIEKIRKSRIGQKHSKETKEKLRIKATGFKHSKETKEKLSAIRIKFLDKNPDKIPYILNHSSKQSYPEKYFEDCFKDIQIESEFKILRYSLDFANPKHKRYVEIDGDQHYTDKTIIKHDIKRTDKLSDLGWLCRRVRWSNFIKKTKDERTLIVNDLKNFLIDNVTNIWYN